jgi:hypothetical protein
LPYARPCFAERRRAQEARDEALRAELVAAGAPGAVGLLATLEVGPAVCDPSPALETLVGAGLVESEPDGRTWLSRRGRALWMALRGLR